MRNAGFKKEADAIEFAGEDGTIYDELTHLEKTGKVDVIAKMPIDECLFFWVTTFIQSPSSKLHVYEKE